MQVLCYVENYIYWKVQEILHDNGFDISSEFEDDLFGEKSKEALIEYQKKETMYTFEILPKRP